MAHSGTEARLRVLVVSRNYPNNVLERLGLWVERPVREIAASCDVKVVSPSPYCPPLPGMRQYTRFRQVEPQRQVDGIPVFHPRFLVGPGRTLYNVEAVAYYLGILRRVDQLRSTFPFQVIHAYFAYPDGVVAAWLGRRYGVPVFVTEQAPWRPWMDQCPFVRRQTVRSARNIAFYIAVSRSVQRMIAHFTGTPDRIRVIPNGVDGAVFSPSASGRCVNPDQVLFVGFINYNKGIDVLLPAFRQLLRTRPTARLVLIGGSFYRNTRLQEERLRQMARELELGDRVVFAGPQSPDEVARYMRESALLVLPSRAESFGAVLVEALACGTPVVATRCGGPEDVVTDEVGVLVPPEDVDALAAGIDQVLGRRSMYDPDRLRNYALRQFSWQRVARDTVSLYEEVIGRRPQSERHAVTGLGTT